MYERIEDGLYLHCRRLCVPLNGVLKGGSSFLHAAPSSGIADWEVVGAAVLLIIATDSIVQGAASPGKAVAEKLPLAAASATCFKITVLQLKAKVTGLD